jgi:[ribosomal protein S5]-alanine N-acetyltransferase
VSVPAKPPVPRLETERLVLRLPAPREAARMAAFALANREHLGRWEPIRAADHFTREAHHAALVRAGRDARAGRHYRWWIFARAEPKVPLGHVGVSNVVRGAFHSAHLGFALAESAVGRGVMHEALVAVVRCAFDTLGLHRLEANHLPENERSARLLARLGFERTGLAPRYLRIAGEWRDHVQTQLLNDTWTPPR